MVLISRLVPVDKTHGFHYVSSGDPWLNLYFRQPHPCLIVKPSDYISAARNNDAHLGCSCAVSVLFSYGFQTSSSLLHWLLGNFPWQSSPQPQAVLGEIEKLENK